MRRMMSWPLMCLVAAGIVGMSPLHAAVPDAVRKALDERFRLSRVAVESELIEGRIFNPGTIFLPGRRRPGQEVSCGLAPRAAQRDPTAILGRIERWLPLAPVS
jgi:hypothetical protein